MFSLTEGRQYFYTLLFYDEVMNFIQSFHSKIKSKQFTQDELNKVKCFIEDFTSDFAKAFDNEAKYGEPLTRDEVKGISISYSWHCCSCCASSWNHCWRYYICNIRT